MARFLSAYEDVFSQGKTDVGQIDLVHHSIPLAEGTKPIRQPPRRLGAEKDREVDEQVAQLVQRGMVEPTDRFPGGVSPEKRSIPALMRRLQTAERGDPQERIPAAPD